MSDDRRKKLEEAKAKRIALLNSQKTGTSGISSNMTQNTNAANQVDQIIKDTLNKNTNIDIDEIRKQASYLKESMQRYKSEILTTSKLSETILGYNPECYDAEIQTESLNKNYSSGEEEEQKTVVVKEKGYHRSSMWASAKTKIISSNKKGFDIDEKKINEKQEENTTTKNKLILNDDYKRQIMTSHELNDFLSKNSKYVERALGEKEVFDIFKTYYDEDGDNDIELKRSWITPLMEFYDAEICSNRVVNSLEWSLKHQELLLCGYTKSNDFSINQANGLILLWSLAMRKAPEFTFTCQTEVTSAIFHKFNPKLVIGATYTGQILIWDTRGKSLPVQKTPPGGKFHSHPVYCLGVNGTTNSNNIISVSNDGVLCSWSMSNLSKPTKRIELKHKKRRNEGQVNTVQSSSTEEVGAICMAIQENELNTVFIGSDDSDIYQVYTHQNNDNTDNIVEIYRNHTGPINSLDIHPGDFHKHANFGHLFLSASADWTINLWSKNFSESPILTFDLNDDYIYDARWHPTNPSLFASADGMGNLDLWDLNKDVECSIFRYGVSKNALNKMSWSQDGKRLAIGDSIGKTTILNIDKEFSNSKIEDSIKFEKVISYAKNNKKGY